MKKLMRTFALMAVAALGLSACTGEKLVPDNGNADGKFVTVHFGAEASIEGATKATLTPDAGETAFQAAWENEDEISVKYSNDSESENATGTTTATWNGASFESKMPEYTGMWIYDAAYPVPDATDSHVDFGPNRTQKGNAYNSKYDIMIGSAVAENAAAGKDDSGKDIVFMMTRQTAIAYFHFTSELDEAVTSATLTVSGEGAAIASNYAYVSDFAWAPYEDCQSITITFPEAAPNAQDFQLWFNVLPTNYASMTLTVETATKTFTISKSTDGKYEAGKLYKVKKSVSWTDKGSEPGKTYAYKKISSQSELTDGSYLIVNEDYSFAVAGSKTASNMIKGGAGTDVDIVGDVIAYSAALALDAFEINSVEGGFSIKGSNCGYIGYSLTSNNGLQGSSSTVYVNTISVSTGVATVTTKNSSSTTYTLCCNPNNDTPLVKYYKPVADTYKGLSLYKYQLVDASSLPTTYTISMDYVIGGTISASVTSAEEGTEVTLTATPDAGYAFNNDWAVKDADEGEIPVNEGKFTMPAKDVTVSGSFSKVDYTITKATCEGGSFTVKKDGVEVTKAQIGESITLTASAAEGYEFDGWTVTNESTSKTVYVNENSFTMPGSNVTVSANFLKADEIPVYASVADLIADGEPTSEGEYVTVTLSNEEITKFFTTKAGDRRGVYFTVGEQEIELFGDIACPAEWVAGGWVSGTLTKCKWMIFNSTWELCPSDWSELTYAAPCATPEITLNGAEASITCTTEGATIRYTLDGKDPVETSDVYTAVVTLTDGQTIKAKAFLTGHKPSEVASKKYSSTGGETTYSFDITVSSFSNTSWSSYATKEAAITGSDNKTYSITGENMAYNKDYIQIRSSKKSKIYNTTSIGKIRSIVISDDTQATFTVKSGSTKDACNTLVSAESDKRTFNFTGDASYFTIEVGNTTIAHVTKITVTYE